MGRFVKASSSNVIRFYEQSVAPTALEGITLGDMWVDTSGTPTVKVCTSISPVTFASVGGGGGSSAPSDAEYVVLSSNGTLTNESVLAVGSSKLTLTGSTLDIDITALSTALNLSGTNTGDQTNITGNAGTVTNGVYTTDVGTVTNTMLAGSIANNKLANTAVANLSGTNTGDQDLSGLVPYTGATGSVNLGVNGLTVHNIKGDASDGLLIESNNGTDVGLLGAGNTANATWYGNHNFDTVTASTIAGFGASKTLQSISVGTGLSFAANTLTCTVTDTVSDSFKTIAVSGQSDIVADSSTDTLTLAAGSNITITTNATTDTVTIAASGGGSSNSFETIVVSGQSDVVADSSTDTLTLVAGSNMTITTNATTDTITFASSGGGGNSFSTITVSGQSDVVADGSSDTLTLVAGSSVTITTDAGTDSITITAKGLTTTEGASTQRVFNNTFLPSWSSATRVTGDRAYFVYMGQVKTTCTPKKVKLYCSTVGTGAQTAELGLFSTPAAPSCAGQTLTKIESTGTITSHTGGVPTLVQNTSDFTTSVAAGTHLWAGYRAAFATSQPAFFSHAMDNATGNILWTTIAGALTAAGPWTGVLTTASTAMEAPRMFVTLD